MSTVTSLFEQAQLAEAAYADFSNPNVSIKDALIAEKMSDAQATEFVTHWRVVHQIPDTISGFSATLFESLDNPGQFSLAIRGSTWDALGLDFQADIADIFLDGVVLEQLVDMYNYWQSLNHNGVYQAKQPITLETETAALRAAYLANPAAGLAFETALRLNSNILIDKPTLTVRTIQTVDSTQLADVSLQNGTNVQGLVGVNVDGHSLGGHLAMAFSRLFPTNTGIAVGVNGLGFLPTSSNVNNLFAMLGGAGSFDTNKILNVYGEKGFEVAAQDAFLKQVGGYEGIFIENVIFPASVALGHGVRQMTDSLAVANLFIKLDVSFATKTPAQALSTLNALMEKGSNQAAQSLEKLVIGLSETILGTKPTIATDDRESLYLAIKNLLATDSSGQPTGAFSALIGKVTLVAPPTSASEARNDLGAFLSLHYLTPFSLKVEDAGALNSLYEAHDAIADLWNDDRNLTAEQISNGEANFSDMYLNDRAAMLGWQNRINAEDFVATNALGYSSSGAASQIFEDPTTRIVINGSIGNERYIKFGENIGPINTDTLTGGDKADHLYGMGGNDSINGGKGNDYIEGNAGQDTLNGGEGNDILIGGTEVDILDGGEGNDQLKGGAGADVYKLSGTYGTDIITDSDGVGIITVDNVALTGGTQVTGNIYRNESQQYTYTLAGSGDTQSLFIQKDDSENKIIIRNWTTANNLNITLQDQAVEEKPVTLGGDFEKFNAANNNEWRVAA